MSVPPGFQYPQLHFQSNNSDQFVFWGGEQSFWRKGEVEVFTSFEANLKRARLPFMLVCT
jgi:hypothetical protein